MSDGELQVAATVVLVRDGRSGPEVLMLRRPDRGSFAGAWVFPGGKVDDDDGEDLPADAEESDIARVTAVRETWEEVGLNLDPAALTLVSCWVPPAGLPLRIRTWFFVAPAPGGDIVPQPDEVEEHLWLSPSEALDRHGRGQMLLYPPTWVTLHGMSDQRDAATVIAEVRLSGPGLFKSEGIAGGRTIVWEGDAQHSAGEGRGTHRLEMGRLPWTYTRSP